MKLRELQELFHRVVIGDATPSDLRSLHSLVANPKSRPQPQDRLRVYSDAWFTRLEESLRDDFEYFARKIGEKKWEGIARGYLSRFPPRSFSLSDLGDRFVDYLCELARFSPQEDGVSPWLIDLARLEWALFESTIAKDSELWDPSELQSLSEEDSAALRMELQPFVRLLAFNWNAYDIIDDAEPSAGPHYVLVSREDNTATREVVSEQEFVFLKKVEAKSTLEEIAASFPDEDSRWVGWLSRHAAAGSIKPINSGSDPQRS